MALSLLVPLITSLAGTAMSAIGQKKAGSQSKQIAELNAKSLEDIAALNAQLITSTADSNAEVLAYNSRILEARSRDALRRGADDETQFRHEVRVLGGTQRSGYAGQNVDVNSGSALDVQMDTAYQGELDAIAIRVNAAREAWGYKVEAESTRMQERALKKNAELEARATILAGRSRAAALRLGGNADAAAGTYGALGTVLTGAYNAYALSKRRNA